MGYYSQKVEAKLKKVKTKLNRLFYYDNPTYHIRFSMLPVETYKKYCEYKIEGNLEMMQNIINTKSVVICESGVQHNPSIKSFSIKSTCGMGATFHQPESITSNMELVLEDIEGMSLMNKINAVAYVLGYGNGIMQMPFFITLWFEGYNIYDEEGRRLTEPNWCIERRRYFYEVIISDCTSQVTTTKTTWNMKLVTNGLDIMGKNFSGLANLGAITIPKGEDYVITVANAAAKYINQRIKDSYPSTVYDKLFNSAKKNHKDAFRFIVYDQDNNIIADTDPTGIKPKAAKFITVNKSGQSETTINISNKNSAQTATTQASTSDTSKPRLATAENIYRPEKNTSIANLFNKLITTHMAETNLAGLTANVLFDRQYVGSYRGRCQYITIASVYLQKKPGFYRTETNETLNSQFDKLEDKQLEYIDFCSKKGLFLRKYEWLQNNEGGGVLSFDTKLDHLWYASSGLSEMRLAEQTLMSTFGSRDKSWEEKVANYNDTFGKKYEETVEKITKMVSSSKQAIKNDLYSIDDWYRYIKVNSLLPGQILAPIAVADNTNTTEQKTSTANTVQNAMNRVMGVVGYNNLIDAGHACEIQFRIVGDPIWLEIGNAIPTIDQTNFYNAHIIFGLNSLYNLNDRNEYETDELDHLIMPYHITEIFSEFKEGKFEQSLTAFVPLQFLWSGAQIESSMEEKGEKKNTSTATKQTSTKVITK